MGEHTWRGVPISEIYGSQSPWGAPEFPLIVPSFSHAVLYHIPSTGRPHQDSPPKPKLGSDLWNHDFVRMPCSNQSLYPVENSNGETKLIKRWEIIEQALSKPIRNSQELADAILSYNTKFKSLWKFKALHKLFNEYLEEEESEYFFNVTLPEIVKLTLALPKLIQSPIPLLKQHKNKSVSLSQQQIASLLANAFFCTFPRRNTTKKSSEYASYPYINLNRLFNSSGSDSILEKLKCICHYFRRVTTKVPVGVVSFSRRTVAADALPLWAASERPVCSLPVHVDSETTIEDAQGLIQVDFANKFLGGGVLNFGCVQEEIRFVICPELMISMLFTEMLKPNEALMMIGCERYSTYSGYGHSFHWSGDYVDSTPIDSSGRRRCAVLAIDALPYASARHEHNKDMITRELNKAWVGVSYGTDPRSEGLNYPGVATGNWGCGAFGGTPHLKSLIQIMACAQAKRPMAYYTFNDTELRDDIVNVYNLLARYNVTVGKLYKCLGQYSTDARPNQLHAYLQQKLLDENKPKSPVVEVMDASEVPMEISSADTSSPIKKAPANNSPDLFSQEELDQSEYNRQMNDLVDAAERGELFNPLRNDSGERTVPNGSSGEKTAPYESKEQTTRLFDEMKKFDEENGTLNFSAPNTSPLKQSRVLNSDYSNDVTKDSDEKIHLDVSPEIKKKMSRKITDYFSKKSI
ncbi:hypothetical protein evm_005693 [Chilo suppressalis]|nr:hypothetical protein evm_005693 [Chilo suppressalis]